MVRIAVLGCGRIGRMHAANIAAHPRAELGGCVRRASTGGRGRVRQRSVPGSSNSAESRPRQRRRRCRADREFDPDAFGPHRGGGRGRQAGALREADRPQPRAGHALRRAHPRRTRCRSCSASCAGSIPAIAPCRRRSATGRSASCTRWRSPRAIPAWRRSAISRRSGGHLPGHDDPRLRHGPLHPRRGGRRPSPPPEAAGRAADDGGARRLRHGHRAAHHRCDACG